MKTILINILNDCLRMLIGIYVDKNKADFKKGVSIKYNNITINMQPENKISDLDIEQDSENGTVSILISD
ncbi:hypothetical protein [Capybara microvirus Cap1_SP_127]|nr:hypothetical protein [Capybara microvirus Cap1_SP_127]